MNKVGINRENCGDKMDQFLKRCFYHSGQYNSEEDFAELNTKLKEKEVFFFHSLHAYYLCQSQ